MSNNTISLNLMEDRCITIFDFIRKLDNNKIRIILPEVQRPLAWGVKKIKEIFKNNEIDYFGNITFQGKNNQFSLIDGQQRLSIFIMAYNYAKGLENDRSILDSTYLTSKERTCFRKVYSSKGSLNSLGKGELELIKNAIGQYGYVDNIEKIHSLNKELIINKLKNIYISISIIPDTISEYDVFISMNSFASPLAESDILKAFFIKNLIEKNPTNIQELWQNMLSKTAKAKVYLDDMIVRFLSMETAGMTKKKFVNYYKDKIKTLKNKKNGNNSLEKKEIIIDDEIGAIVNNMSTFINGFSAASTFKEKESSIPTKAENYFDALVKLALNSKFIYKPYISLILKYREKCLNKADKLKDFISFLLISFYMHALNKKAKAKEIENYKFLMGNKFRNNVEDLFLKYSIKNYDWKIFIIPFKVETSKNIYNDEDCWNEVFHMLKRKTKDKDIGKSIRILLEWYFGSNTKKNFFDFKSKMTVEHFQEKVTINKSGKKIVVSEKNKNYDSVFFIEGPLHDRINLEIKKILNDSSFIAKNKKEMKLELESLKIKIYKKSDNSFTKNISKNIKFENRWIDF
ncbi:MAG: DUF262 domain-containing protein [Mycoplasmatales bacterium]|nr:DUF262 domain-containing protein [Mycoplasmatales bacterium]